MTHLERQLLRFIEQYLADHDGVAPTLAEMASAVGVASKSGAHRLLESLERQQLIRREPNQTRAVRLVVPAVDLSKVPDGTLLAEVASRGLIRAEG